MSTLEIVDTFPRFKQVWQLVAEQPVEEQITAWEHAYMGEWPELRQIQLDEYIHDQMDWKGVARERVFPGLPARLADMTAAHSLLLEISGDLFRQTCSVLNLDLDAVFVIYVGIGCGAGWVARYQHCSAILFGLENIAEEGWARPEILRGLVSHEIGHLAHFYWLEQAGLSRGEGAWWQLFEEGFAQRCEHVVQGEETWHMAHGDGVEGWLNWCREHRSWLAGEYLSRLHKSASVKDFFGSWFDISGYKQSGYYLGHEVVRQLEKESSLKEIVCLTDLEARVLETLEHLSAE